MTALLGNFLIILVATVFEFVAGSAAGLRNVRWSIDWLRFFDRVCGDWAWFRGWVAVALVVGLPVIGTWLVAALLHDMASVLGYVFGLVVLVLMIGPEDLSAEVERHKKIVTAGSDQGQGVLPSYLRAGHETDLGPASGDDHFDATRAELAAMAIGALRAWYTPLFWFLLAGAAGAVAYRLVSNLNRLDGQEPATEAAMRRTGEALEWLPARLSVLMMGLAGTLVPVIDAARNLDALKPGGSRRLVGRAVLAATDYGRIGEVIQGDPHVYRINQIHALLQRVMVLWLVTVAAIALALN